MTNQFEEVMPQDNSTNIQRTHIMYNKSYIYFQMCPWSYNRKNKYSYKFKYWQAQDADKYIKCYMNYVRIFIYI